MTSLEVEKEIRIDINGIELLGYIDTIDDKNNVRDFKTAGKSKNESELNGSLQMAIYSIAYETLYEKMPDKIIYDVLISTKKPKYQKLELPPARNTYSRVHAVVEEVQRAIKAGVFLPAAEGSWACSPRFCGYYNTCKFTQNKVF